MFIFQCSGEWDRAERDGENYFELFRSFAIFSVGSIIEKGK